MNAIPFILLGLGVLLGLVFLARAAYSDCLPTRWDLVTIISAFLCVAGALAVAGVQLL